jgi:hypothetical protein
MNEKYLIELFKTYINVYDKKSNNIDIDEIKTMLIKNIKEELNKEELKCLKNL